MSNPIPTIPVVNKGVVQAEKPAIIAGLRLVFKPRAV